MKALFIDPPKRTDTLVGLMSNQYRPNTSIAEDNSTEVKIDVSEGKF